MGWIIFVVVVLFVLGGMRRKTTTTRRRMSQQLSVLQTQAHQLMQPSGPAPTGQPLPPVYNPAALPVTGSRQFAQSMKALQAVLAGKLPVGTAPLAPPGSSSTYQLGNSLTAQPGNTAVYAPGDAAAYAPVVPVESRPRVTRPAPPQKGYQGSTAVSGSSLSTTLVTPYQPTSLMTSLSSSLSSSLTDSPPRVARTAAFSGVEIISLPAEVADQVRFHLRNGHEVEAVRLVCDTMNVGLLEATKTVRSYA